MVELIVWFPGNQAVGYYSEVVPRQGEYARYGNQHFLVESVYYDLPPRRGQTLGRVEVVLAPYHNRHEGKADAPGDVLVETNIEAGGPDADG